ncbi:hypothetical protein Fmac_011283 [Flemingia macrophylla]|uniref:Receptor-like serine/threonine-protein kinase n=1 Tax=Flemingia macrophylla TaxID=520843 RepID=A0ABD1MM01_9FABA
MCFINLANLFFVLFMLCRYVLDFAIAIDTITSSQSMKDPETISSEDGNFTLGFFTPQNSTKRYVGIWWKSQSTVIWVANRNQPLNDSSGVVTISEDGNLVVMNGLKHVIWSTNVSNTSSNTSAQLSDSAKLVLTEITTGTILWDSFQQPSNALLPGLKLSSNKRSGTNNELTSWESPSNPSVGSFYLSVVKRINIVQVFIWNETRPYWRSGPWNGGVFTGIPDMTTYIDGFKGVDDDEGNTYIYYTVQSTIGFVVYMLNSKGRFEQIWWDDEKKQLQICWTSQESDCDVYGICGPFSSCNSQSSPICSCLKGFEPMNKEEWNRQNWTSGCVRRSRLKCERVKEQNASLDLKEDGFWEMKMVKVPDFPEGSPVTPDICRSQCLENCSCVAYSHDDNIGCISWTGNLLDIQQLSSDGLDLYVRVAHSELGKGSNKTIIITIIVIMGTFIIVSCAYLVWRASNHPDKIWHLIKSRKRNNKGFDQFNNGESPENSSQTVIEELSQVKLQELLVFDFERVATATNNFHLSNKLGQGGFGPVYKGKLQDGQEIAVKRLSTASGQGLEEFMNEVVVISKLQHRNLVRLLGCCVEGDEKMLIYEYMSNKSLDVFVFDPSKSKLLDWSKRRSIIEGIARGSLYLHRDSRLKIIHRDLKASNILLDEEMNPKISDFGMARIFGGSEDQANTNRVVGTYGYMSPEYAMQGLFSEKSDVFSFGVLVLEIISGRRNSVFYDDELALSLLGFAWIQWKEGNILPLIDPTIYNPNHHKDILRCIHIGLLCVQEHAIDRPIIAGVISMLISEVAFLPPPSQPAFIRRQNMLNLVSPIDCHTNSSLNTISNTTIHGR